MLKKIFFFFITILLTTSAVAENISVLFIGNSFVSVNNLPSMVAAMAKSLGDEVEVGMVAPGAYRFKSHVNDATTLAAINAKKWTFVVLQEQSQLPTFSLQQFDQETLANALQLDKLIHAHNAATKTVFFQTWGFANGDAANCSSIPAVCNYAGMQDLLDTRYVILAQQASAVLAPVGEAWGRVRKQYPNIPLYAADDKHPSLQGSYLVACVFYEVFFKKSVMGAAGLGLSAEEAKILQRVASEVVLGAH